MSCDWKGGGGKRKKEGKGARRDARCGGVGDGEGVLLLVVVVCVCASDRIERMNPLLFCPPELELAVTFDDKHEASSHPPNLTQDVTWLGVTIHEQQLIASKLVASS